MDGSREDGRREAEGGVGSSSGAAAGKAVDDQIAALERELQGSSSGSSSGSSEDSSSDEESLSSTSGGEDTDHGRERSEQANSASTTSSSRERRRQLKLVSPLEAEKIEPLPAHLLPRPGCGLPKANSKKKPKKPKGGPKGGDGGVDGTAPAPSQGLHSAVKELLANYEARSSERVPFYCRVCQFQGQRCVGVRVFGATLREALDLSTTLRRLSCTCRQYYR